MKLKIAAAAIGLLVVGYFVGPQPTEPKYPIALPGVPQDAHLLEAHITTREARHQLKAGNEAQIVWYNNETRAKTEYALVYLHGFSASHHEGFPLHRRLAEKYGCNLYLARLEAHGIDTTDALIDFSAEGYYKSALYALAVGRAIGEKVIIVSTSTGCTAALQLASDFPWIHALVNLSPNVRINDPFAFLLNDPWGIQLAKIAMGGDFRKIDGGPEYARYWYDYYRTESLAELQELVETTMTPKTFGRINQPVFNGFYYADEDAQDPVVKVSAIRWMHELLATPDSLKVARAFADAQNHVLASPIKSKDAEGVLKAVEVFIEEVIGVKPVANHPKNG